MGDAHSAPFRLRRRGSPLVLAALLLCSATIGSATAADPGDAPAWLRCAVSTTRLCPATAAESRLGAAAAIAAADCTGTAPSAPPSVSWVAHQSSVRPLRILASTGAPTEWAQRYLAPGYATASAPASMPASVPASMPASAPASASAAAVAEGLAWAAASQRGTDPSANATAAGLPGISSGAATSPQPSAGQGPSSLPWPPLPWPIEVATADGAALPSDPIYLWFGKAAYYDPGLVEYDGLPEETAASAGMQQRRRLLQQIQGSPPPALLSAPINPTSPPLPAPPLPVPPPPAVYDAWLVAGEEVGAALSAARDAPSATLTPLDLTPLVRRDRAVQWGASGGGGGSGGSGGGGGLLPAYEYSLYRMGGLAAALPLGVSAQLLYWNRDLLVARGMEPPRTWAQLVAAAGRLHGQDLIGDGSRGYGLCLVSPPPPFHSPPPTATPPTAAEASAAAGCCSPDLLPLLLDVWSSLVQSSGPRQGFWFSQGPGDTEAMRPWLDSEAMREALRITAALRALGPPPAASASAAAGGGDDPAAAPGCAVAAEMLQPPAEPPRKPGSRRGSGLRAATVSSARSVATAPALGGHMSLALSGRCAFIIAPGLSLLKAVTASAAAAAAAATAADSVPVNGSGNAAGGLTASALFGRLGVSPLPGSTHAWRLSTDSLRACTASTCPFAEPLPDYGGGTGMTGANATTAYAPPPLTDAANSTSAANAVIVSRQQDQRPLLVNRAPVVTVTAAAVLGGGAIRSPEIQLLAYALFSSRLSGATAMADVLDTSSRANPFRYSHLASTYPWVAAGYHPSDAAAALAAYGTTMTHPNLALPLSVPGTEKYLRALRSLATQYIAAAAAAAAAGALETLEALPPAPPPLTAPTVGPDGETVDGDVADGGGGGGGGNSGRVDAVKQLMAAAAAAVSAAFAPEPDTAGVNLVFYQRSLRTWSRLPAHVVAPGEPLSGTLQPDSADGGDSGSGGDGHDGGRLADWLIATVAIGCGVGVLILAVIGVDVAARCVQSGWSAHLMLRGAVQPPGPSRELTLLLSDIEGSTTLWEDLTPMVMDQSMRMHASTFRKLLLLHRGYESATEGDAFICAFASPTAALAFSLQLQVALLDVPWPKPLLQEPSAAELYVLPRLSPLRMGAAWADTGAAGGLGPPRLEHRQKQRQQPHNPQRQPSGGVGTVLPHWEVGAGLGPQQGAEPRRRLTRDACTEEGLQRQEPQQRQQQQQQRLGRSQGQCRLSFEQTATRRAATADAGGCVADAGGIGGGGSSGDKNGLSSSLAWLAPPWVRGSAASASAGRGEEAAEDAVAAGVVAVSEVMPRLRPPLHTATSLPCPPHAARAPLPATRAFLHPDSGVSSRLGPGAPEREGAHGQRSSGGVFKALSSPSCRDGRGVGGVVLSQRHAPWTPWGTTAGGPSAAAVAVAAAAAEAESGPPFMHYKVSYDRHTSRTYDRTTECTAMTVPSRGNSLLASRPGMRRLSSSVGTPVLGVRMGMPMGLQLQTAPGRGGRGLEGCSAGSSLDGSMAFVNGGGWPGMYGGASCGSEYRSPPSAAASPLVSLSRVDGAIAGASATSHEAAASSAAAAAAAATFGAAILPPCDATPGPPIIPGARALLPTLRAPAPARVMQAAGDMDAAPFFWGTPPPTSMRTTAPAAPGGSGGVDCRGSTTISTAAAGTAGGGAEDYFEAVSSRSGADSQGEDDYAPSEYTSAMFSTVDILLDAGVDFVAHGGSRAGGGGGGGLGGAGGSAGPPRDFRRHVLELYRPCAADAPGALCVYRGLRLRLGLHCGCREAQVELRPNKASGRVIYGGLLMTVARAIANNGHGGSIMLSDAARRRLLAAGQLQGGGADGATTALYMGHFVLPRDASYRPPPGAVSAVAASSSALPILGATPAAAAGRAEAEYAGGLMVMGTAGVEVVGGGGGGDDSGDVGAATRADSGSGVGGDSKSSALRTLVNVFPRFPPPPHPYHHHHNDTYSHSYGHAPAHTYHPHTYPHQYTPLQGLLPSCLAAEARSSSEGGASALYQVAGGPRAFLSVRAAMEPPISRAGVCVAPGTLSAPLGPAVAIAELRAAGSAVLAAWNRDVFAASLELMAACCRQVASRHPGVTLAHEAGGLKAQRSTGLVAVGVAADAAALVAWTLECSAAGLELPWPRELLAHRLGEELLAAQASGGSGASSSVMLCGDGGVAAACRRDASGALLPLVAASASSSAASSAFANLVSLVQLGASRSRLWHGAASGGGSSRRRLAVMGAAGGGYVSAVPGPAGAAAAASASSRVQFRSAGRRAVAVHGAGAWRSNSLSRAWQQQQQQQLHQPGDPRQLIDPRHGTAAQHAAGAAAAALHMASAAAAATALQGGSNPPRPRALRLVPGAELLMSGSSWTVEEGGSPAATYLGSGNVSGMIAEVGDVNVGAARAGPPIPAACMGAGTVPEPISGLSGPLAAPVATAVVALAAGVAATAAAVHLPALGGEDEPSSPFSVAFHPVPSQHSHPPRTPAAMAPPTPLVPYGATAAAASADEATAADGRDAFGSPLQHHPLHHLQLAGHPHPHDSLSLLPQPHRAFGSTLLVTGPPGSCGGVDSAAAAIGSCSINTAESMGLLLLPDTAASAVVAAAAGSDGGGESPFGHAAAAAAAAVAAAAYAAAVDDPGGGVTHDTGRVGIKGAVLAAKAAAAAAAATYRSSSVTAFSPIQQPASFPSNGINNTFGDGGYGAAGYSGPGLTPPLPSGGGSSSRQWRGSGAQPLFMMGVLPGSGGSAVVCGGGGGLGHVGGRMGSAKHRRRSMVVGLLAGSSADSVAVGGVGGGGGGAAACSGSSLNSSRGGGGGGGGGGGASRGPRLRRQSVLVAVQPSGGSLTVMGGRGGNGGGGGGSFTGVHVNNRRRSVLVLAIAERRLSAQGHYQHQQQQLQHQHQHQHQHQQDELDSSPRRHARPQHLSGAMPASLEDSDGGGGDGGSGGGGCAAAPAAAARAGVSQRSRASRKQIYSNRSAESSSDGGDAAGNEGAPTPASGRLALIAAPYSDTHLQHGCTATAAIPTVASAAASARDLEVQVLLAAVRGGRGAASNSFTASTASPLHRALVVQQQQHSQHHTPPPPTSGSEKTHLSAAALAPATSSVNGNGGGVNGGGGGGSDGSDIGGAGGDWYTACAGSPASPEIEPQELPTALGVQSAVVRPRDAVHVVPPAAGGGGGLTPGSRTVSLQPPAPAHWPSAFGLPTSPRDHRAHQTGGGGDGPWAWEVGMFSTPSIKEHEDLSAPGISAAATAAAAAGVRVEAATAALAMEDEEEDEAELGAVGRLVYRGLRLKGAVDVGTLQAAVVCASGKLLYRGRPADRVSALAAIAWSGQLLVTEVAVRSACQLPAAVRLDELYTPAAHVIAPSSTYFNTAAAAAAAAAATQQPHQRLYGHSRRGSKKQIQQQLPSGRGRGPVSGGYIGSAPEGNSPTSNSPSPIWRQPSMDTTYNSCTNPTSSAAVGGGPGPPSLLASGHSAAAAAAMAAAAVAAASAAAAGEEAGAQQQTGGRNDPYDAADGGEEFVAHCAPQRSFGFSAGSRRTMAVRAAVANLNADANIAAPTSRPGTSADGGGAGLKVTYGPTPGEAIPHGCPSRHTSPYARRYGGSGGSPGGGSPEGGSPVGGSGSLFGDSTSSYIRSSGASPVYPNAAWGRRDGASPSPLLMPSPPLFQSRAAEGVTGIAADVEEAAQSQFPFSHPPPLPPLPLPLPLPTPRTPAPLAPYWPSAASTASRSAAIWVNEESLASLPWGQQQQQQQQQQAQQQQLHPQDVHPALAMAHQLAGASPYHSDPVSAAEPAGRRWSPTPRAFQQQQDPQLHRQLPLPQLPQHSQQQQQLQRQLQQQQRQHQIVQQQQGADEGRRSFLPQQQQPPSPVWTSGGGASPGPAALHPGRGPASRLPSGGGAGQGLGRASGSGGVNSPRIVTNTGAPSPGVRSGLAGLFTRLSTGAAPLEPSPTSNNHRRLHTAASLPPGVTQRGGGVGGACTLSEHLKAEAGGRRGRGRVGVTGGGGRGGAGAALDERGRLVLRVRIRNLALGPAGSGGGAGNRYGRRGGGAVGGGGAHGQTSGNGTPRHTAASLGGGAESRGASGDGGVARGSGAGASWTGGGSHVALAFEPPPRQQLEKEPRALRGVLVARLL